MTTRTEQVRFELDDDLGIQHTKSFSGEAIWKETIEEECDESVASWTSLKQIEDSKENLHHGDLAPATEEKTVDPFYNIPWENPFERNKSLVYIFSRNFPECSGRHLISGAKFTRKKNRCACAKDINTQLLWCCCAVGCLLKNCIFVQATITRMETYEIENIIHNGKVLALQDKMNRVDLVKNPRPGYVPQRSANTGHLFNPSYQTLEIADYKRKVQEKHDEYKKEAKVKVEAARERHM